MKNSLTYIPIINQNEQTTKKSSGNIQGSHSEEQDLAAGIHSDYGQLVKKGIARMNIREPLEAAFSNIKVHINTIISNPITTKRNPLPEDPRANNKSLPPVITPNGYGWMK